MPKGVYKRKPFTEEHIRKLSEANKRKHNSPQTEIKKGFKHSEETKRKISENHSRHNLGKHLSDETKRKLSEANRGEKHPQWKGGISFEIYPTTWKNDLKESIRKRDKHICQFCKKHQLELKEKLSIHHIDYNKYNLNPNNLISLCRNCHAKTNFNRENWINYFK
jgi:5-methylcytosine-specific restriction endonuclease McrA